MHTEAKVGHQTVSTLASLSDSQLVLSARNKDNQALEYLLDKYRNFVRAKTRSYFLIGADREDLVQEGMIGLYKDIRDYREDKQSSFRVFAELCITRQMITAIKTATRQKHIPLNSYISLNRSIFSEGDSERTLCDTLAGCEVADPMELIISGEEVKTIRSSFTEILSFFEADVLRLYIDGKSYQEIARELKRHVKSVDNALQRVKRKIDVFLRSKDAQT
ncbi:MAG: RNA polymerase sporulation sigma factor SigH [Chloroflexi bacterium]|nr:RNA polymerase sporulation sigma factor SigH [Chloroflexota bacterium]